jgi:WD40 repeat protein
MRRLLAWGLMLVLGLGLIQARDNEPMPPAEKQPAEEPAEEQIVGKASLAIDNGAHRGVIASMAFSPDGRRLITIGHDRSIQEYDSASGERIRVVYPPTVPFSGARIHAAALIHGPEKGREGDGKVLAVSAAGLPGESPEKPRLNRLYLLHRDTGKIISLRLHGLKPFVSPLAVAGLPQRGLVASFHNDKVLVHANLGAAWGDSKEGRDARRPRWSITVPTGRTIRALALSPDGKKLAATTQEFDNNRLLIWSLGKGEPKLQEGTSKGAGLAVAWSPSGKLILTGHEGGKHPAVRLWTPGGKFKKGFTLEQLSPRLKDTWPVVHQAAFRTENEVLLTVLWGKAGLGNQLVVSLDLESGTSKDLLFMGDIAAPHPGPEEGLAPLVISPDGKLAAVAVEPQGSRIAWMDLTGKEKPRFSGDTHGLVGLLGWNKEGDTIAWKTRDAKPLSLNLKTLELKSVEKPEEFTEQRHERGLWKVQRGGPGGRRYLQILHKGKPVAKSEESLRPYQAFTLSAKGKPWLAMANPVCLTIADAATGKTLYRFRPHKVRFTGLAASPDNRYVLASSSRGLISIYRVEDKPKNLGPLMMIYSRGRDWIVWTTQGYYAATPGAERMMGWVVNNGIDKPATFHPASRFRKLLYRPQLIPLVLEKGDVKLALAAMPKPEPGQKPRAAVESIDDALPPTVTIESVDKSALPTVKLTVSVKAASDKQPIKSLRLLLNGRPLPDKKYVVDLDKGKSEHTQAWELIVPDGDSDLSVLARSEDSMAVSPEKSVHYNQPPASRLLALSVGVNKYKDKKLELKAATNDARAVGIALENRCRLPLFGSAAVKVLLDEKATKKGVLDALAALVSKPSDAGPAKPADLVVIYFACHGVKYKGEYYLLPQDAEVEKLENIPKTCLSGKELRKALSAFPCQVVLLLDACHSGAAGSAFTPATDEVSRDMTEEDVGVVVMAAAMGKEYALEKNGRGFFSRAVEEGINRDKRVPYNFRDKHVYVHHLFSYVSDRVAELSEDAQHPSLNLPSTIQPFPIVPKPEKASGTGSAE